MAGVKNRRPAKADDTPQPANGHPVALDDDEPRENIFLLWPNIIGTARAAAHVFPRDRLPH
jgi:hypothetical protein